MTPQRVINPPVGRRYEIYPYSITRLKELLARVAGTDGTFVESKAHCVYFEEYFTTIGARTIIVENNYADHYFMDDYAGYYVCCFNVYERWCTRLHFFSMEIDTDHFEEVLQSPSDSGERKDLLESYLGFVVVKPLPETIIGRTCLKTFPDDGGRRNYPITRRYRANLFGLNLEVHSLAFQEQDKVVAACSTSALWSILQGTGRIYQHHIPSPVEITKMATTHSPPVPPETRSLPSNGLSVSQMAHAISNLRMSPYFVSPENIDLLKNNVYAYLRGHIPILMVFSLVDCCDDGFTTERSGIHAVAITGYSLGEKKAKPFASRRGKPGFLSRASRVDKFYVHDDQVGPFVRMEFFEEPFEYKSFAGRKKSSPYSMSTSWKCIENRKGFARAVPLAIMVPLYHKIRIPFSTIMESVLSLDRIIEDIRSKAKKLLRERLEWDVRLTTINEVKSDISDKIHLRWEVRREVLLKEMPRFLWRATAWCEKDEVVDLLFDPTDIEQGSFLNHAVFYNDDLIAILKALSEQPEKFPDMKTSPGWKILKWFTHLPKNQP